MSLDHARAEFFHAAREGELDTLRRSLAAGVNPHARDPATQGWNALMIAAQAGHEAVGIEVLRAMQRCPAPASLSYPHPAHYIQRSASLATIKGCAELLSELLLAGATPNGDALHEHPPIFSAAEYGRVECAKILLAAGANPHLRDSRGRDPLMIAAQESQPGMIRLLMEAGARSGRLAKDDRSALQVARDAQATECVELLLGLGAALDETQALDKALPVPAPLARRRGI